MTCRRAARRTTTSPLARRRHRPGHRRPAALARAGEEGPQGRPEPGRAGHRERHAASSVPADTTGRTRQEGARPQAVPGRGRPGTGCRRRRPGGLGARERCWDRLTGLGRRAGRHVRKALVDQGFKSSVVVRRRCRGHRRAGRGANPADRGFVPSRNAGWWSRCSASVLPRRLVRDYEHRLSSSASRVTGR